MSALLLISMPLCLVLAAFCGCGASSMSSQTKVDSPTTQIMLLTFEVKHARPGEDEQFTLRQSRMKKGTSHRPSSQTLEQGKLVVSYLDTMQRVRSWEVIDDPLVRDYEYSPEADSGFRHAIIRRDSASLALIIPYDPLVKHIRFESIGAEVARTTLSTIPIATP